MDLQLEFLHRLDTRLAVLEALSKKHGEETALQYRHLDKQLETLNKELGNLKIRVAGIASIVTLVVMGTAKVLAGLPW